MRCGTDDHNNILAVAWVLVVIWPIGMVVLNAAVLFPCRNVILDETAAESKLLHATAFLHQAYKPAYFWWDIASLIQRTVLTGWFLLIDLEQQFIRLLAALVVSLFFLVAVLACNPYKRKLDYAMAAACQLLFVCTFVGGIVVRLFEDIANDTLGSPFLAHRFLGLRSVEEVVVIMVCVAFLMLAALGLTLCGEMYVQMISERLEARFSVITMNPPYVHWERRAIYACFLSHCKSDCASDARYVHDLLRKMLRMPVFLDSSALRDLRKLVTDGVYKSDVLLLLASKSVLTRPWCLIELLEAHRKRIPVVILQLADSDFTIDDAREYAEQLEDEMEEANPSGFRFLQDRLGTSDLEDVRKAIMHALNVNARHETLLFDGRAGDGQLVATMKDVVERMGRVTGRRIRWHNDLDKGRGSKPGSKSPSNQPTGSNSSRDDEDEGRKESAAFFCCSRDDGLKHARALRSALEVKLGRGCSIGGIVDAVQKLDQSDVMVVLLTKKMLTTPIALLEVFKAESLGVKIITVAVAGAGYDFEAANAIYSDLATALDEENPGTAKEMQANLPNGMSVSTLGERLRATLTAVIAIAWSPLGTKNHLNAVVEDIVSHMPRRGQGKHRGGRVQLQRSKTFHTLSIDEAARLALESRRTGSSNGRRNSNGRRMSTTDMTKRLKDTAMDLLDSTTRRLKDNHAPDSSSSCSLDDRSTSRRRSDDKKRPTDDRSASRRPSDDRSTHRPTASRRSARS